MAKKQGFPYARKISGSGGTVLPVSIPPPASNELRNDFEPYANLAAFPVVGELGLTYLAQDSGKMYYWTGSAYSEMSAGSAETLTSMGTLITSGASKATPIDADEFAIRNSVGGLMAKVTWANIKATLLTYFNTVYLGINAVLTGYTSGAGTVAATDTILQAIQKLNGNVELKAPLTILASSISDSDTTHAPDGNSVFDALALKAPLASPSFTGTVTGAGLIDISGASAGQIKFPATQNASADANTLDDYEEGDVVVAFTSTFGSITIAASRKTLSYTKIGRRVYLNGLLGVDSVSTPSGNIQITGLPFTCLSGDKGISSNGIKVEGLAATVVGSVTIDVTAGTTVANLQKLSAGTATALADYVSSSSYFYVSLSYNI